MTFTSDDVTSAVLVAGVPACALLIVYSAKVWRTAVRRGVRSGTLRYLLGASAGLAISLGGQALATVLSLAAAVAAPPGYYGSALLDTYLEVAVLWPAGWSLLAVVVLLAGRKRLARPNRSVLGALVAGLLVSILPFAMLMVVGFVIPIGLRIPLLVPLVAATVVISVVASHRSRSRGPDQTAGVNQ